MNKNKKTLPIDLFLKIIASIVFVIAIILIIVIFIKGKSIDPNSDFINELYRYIGSNDLTKCGGLENYTEKIVNYDSKSQENKVCNAYLNLEDEAITTLKIDKTKKNDLCKVGENIVFAIDSYEEDICTIMRFKSDDLANVYQKMYNKELMEFDSFKVDDQTICQYENGLYYCGLAEEYTITIGEEAKAYRQIKKVVEKGDKIIIYDYFIKIVNEICYVSNDSVMNKECTDNYLPNKKIESDFLSKNGALYKHTFERNKKNYYWVSSSLA